ncbi:MAG: ABC transporter ATP-binding protein [Dysgonamonadaceae bacterium]|jgi:iron complex transport system ATP-binding protein|nr:ABC transporter ATP-binding protein [Dysgonamonadaceae bacterium]
MIATVEISHLSIGYREGKEKRTVACNLDAVINCGELTCLLGANGAGKSTLLRTLAGFLPKFGGDILIAGKRIEEFSMQDLSKTVGVVLTERVTVRDMVVRDMVGLGRNPHTGFWGRLSAADRAAVDDAVACMKIRDLADRSVHTLSDGERQKVMIAKTLAQETPVIFLDEPAAFLDFPSRVEMMRLLMMLARERNKTVFLSTHDVELAMQISDRLWLLDRHGLKIGTPVQLKHDGSIENFFKCDGVRFDRKNGIFSILSPTPAEAKL